VWTEIGYSMHRPAHFYALEIGVLQMPLEAGRNCALAQDDFSMPAGFQIPKGSSGTDKVARRYASPLDAASDRVRSGGICCICHTGHRCCV
jgi:hypothetical protein